MKLKLYVFRHGQTEFNRDSRFTGIFDAKITNTGLDDARIIAERLKNKKFQTAYHTSLSRSKKTLEQVLKHHPECKTLICDDRMIERSYGKLVKKTHLQVVRTYGPEKYDLWHRSWNIGPPGGESFSDVEKRVSSFIKDLKKYMAKHKVSVAISAHGNSIRLLRKILENLTVKRACEIYIPYDHLYEYTIEVKDEKPKKILNSKRPRRTKR